MRRWAGIVLGRGHLFLLRHGLNVFLNSSASCQTRSGGDVAPMMRPTTAASVPSGKTDAEPALAPLPRPLLAQKEDPPRCSKASPVCLFLFSEGQRCMGNQGIQSLGPGCPPAKSSGVISTAKWPRVTGHARGTLQLIKGRHSIYEWALAC